MWLLRPNPPRSSLPPPDHSIQQLTSPLLVFLSRSHGSGAAIVSDSVSRTLAPGAPPNYGRPALCAWTMIPPGPARRHSCSLIAWLVARAAVCIGDRSSLSRVSSSSPRCRSSSRHPRARRIRSPHCRRNPRELPNRSPSCKRNSRSFPRSTTSKRRTSRVVESDIKKDVASTNSAQSALARSQGPRGTSDRRLCLRRRLHGGLFNPLREVLDISRAAGVLAIRSRLVHDGDHDLPHRRARPRRAHAATDSRAS